MVDNAARAAHSVPRGHRNGVSYEHPLAFWIGILVTTAGVATQLPMFFMARDIHYHLAGMPVTPAMTIGMVSMFVGIGMTAYSVFPRNFAAVAAARRFRVSALDDAPIRLAHEASPPVHQPR